MAARVGLAILAALRPVISGLLRKDPGERLDAAAAERMISLPSSFGPVQARK